LGFDFVIDWHWYLSDAAIIQRKVVQWTTHVPLPKPSY